ncbi:MAG: rod shape-determining protein MreC [Candidatus Acidiferrales bacterium]
MRDFLARHNHLSLLVMVLLGQLFFLAYQIKSDNNVRLIRLWAVAVFAPVERAVHGAADGAGSLVENYITLYNTRQENLRLSEQLDEARLRLHELEARAAQAEELAALLDLKQAYPRAPLLAAKVIGASPAAPSRTVLIDRGSDDGLDVNMAVLTPDGVVGKVVIVFPRASQVLLITDQKSGVGVVLAETNMMGVVKGGGGTLCQLDYVPNPETVAPGTLLLTSGLDQLFPRGLPVGRVLSARPGEAFQEIIVEPAVQLGRLEHVLVLAGPPDTLDLVTQTAVSNGRLNR